MRCRAMSAMFLPITVGLGSLLAAQSQPTPAPPRSLSDGVYTDAQMKRGESLYGQYCANCHNPDLLGNPDVPSVSATARAAGIRSGSPALRGAEFVAKWTGMTLKDLFGRVRTSMPQNAPGSLPRQQNADILAFILAGNAYPAGAQELPGVDAPLDDISIAR